MVVETKEKPVSSPADNKIDGQLRKKVLKKKFRLNPILHEIEQTRGQLSVAQAALRETQDQLELYKIHMRTLRDSWKIRTHEADEKLRIHRRESDLKLKEQVSQLLFLESKSKKEIRDLEETSKRQDRQIDRQRSQLRELELKNQRLRQAIQNAKEQYGGLQHNHCSMSSEDGNEFGGTQIRTDLDVSLPTDFQSNTPLCSSSVLDVSLPSDLSSRPQTPDPKPTRPKLGHRRSRSLSSTFRQVRQLLSPSTDVTDNVHNALGQRTLPRRRSRFFERLHRRK